MLLESKRILSSGLLVVVLAVVSARADAAGLTIGATAPDFAGIVAVDGKPHSLADYKDAKLVVLVFTCNHCPVAKAYEDRLIALQKDYRSKGVQVVAVNVNNLPADRLNEMKKRRSKRGSTSPTSTTRPRKLVATTAPR